MQDIKLESIKDKNFDSIALIQAVKMDVIQFPAEILKKKSIDVDGVSEDIVKLIYNMAKTMYESNGCGIAAIQVGMPLKIFIVDTSKESNSPMIFINPKITWKADFLEPKPEGCLSVVLDKETEDRLGISATIDIDGNQKKQKLCVPRYSDIIIEYFDMAMDKKIIHAGGFLGHVIQHETDHTNGIIYLDLLPYHIKKIIEKTTSKFNPSYKIDK